MVDRRAPGTAPVSTIEAAIRILRAFDDDHPVRGVTDLADELGMDKSRVHRALATLAEGGFVQSVGTLRKYSLGPSLIPLGRRAARASLTRGGAQLVLERLARHAQESVVLCVPDALGYRTVASADGPSQLRFATELGRWFPGHQGATGHVLFAQSSDPKIAERLAQAHEPDEPGEVERIRAAHEDARTQGYLVSVGEFDPRVMAIAAPVLADGHVVAALAILGSPAGRDQTDVLVHSLKKATDELSATLRRPGK